jgi:hypothetical protein
MHTLYDYDSYVRLFLEYMIFIIFYSLGQNSL